jgi:2-amino-4-hydroxy-6-hydroxymethyldihydropteridine diphosphokinase
VVNEGRLQIPRDDIEKYAFVLEPLAEIAGDLRHPVSGLRYADMWAIFEKSGIQQHKITLPIPE